tara:strand:+ start:377 stop:2257 length:1881 start_codon:yes stop_codon:yes gene_type:complete
MNIKKNSKINFKNFLNLIFITLIIFSYKWILSFLYFKDDISLKIIFDAYYDGYFYYIYLDALSSFNFNNSFNADIKNLNNLPMPFLAMVIPALLFKIFGFYSIIILEMLCIFFFLIIFFLIFKKFNFDNNSSILFSVLIFMIPSLIIFLNLETTRYINVLQDIYHLRFARPLIVNLFFYAFILHLFVIEKKKELEIKDFIIIGFLLSLTFSSFYYFFCIQAISLIIYFTQRDKFYKLFSFKKIKLYFLAIGVFLIFSIPFIYFLISSEPDYKERLFIIDLDLERKKIILSYLLQKILDLKFLIVLFLCTILNYFSYLKNFKNKNNLNILYIIFISSVLAPFLFIIISNKTGLIYHFANIILITSFLYFLFFFINYFFHEKDKNFFQKKIPFILSILILILIYNFNVHKSFQIKINNEEYVSYRNSISQATQVIQNIGNKEISLLTFEPTLMVWGILNKIKNIDLLSGQLVPKTHDMIENDLIKSFKFLNLNDEAFLNFFENKISAWRLFNPNTQLFFWGKYSASILKTFNNSNNFNLSELQVIQKTTPLNVQSLAIPIEEFDRLKKKFNSHNKSDNINPNFIVLNKSKFFIEEPVIKNRVLCTNISTKDILIYISKNLKAKCKINY